MKVFVEEQRFSSYIFILLIIVFLITAIPTAINIEEFANQGTAHLLGALLGSVISLLVIVLFVFLKLKTRIDEKGIHYQFLPVHFSEKSIVWEDIDQCFVRKYKPLTEYGGWGIRGLGKKNKAYNTKGSIGLQLILKNGRKLLIGTQKRDEIEQVIKTYKHKITNG